MKYYLVTRQKIYRVHRVFVWDLVSEKLSEVHHRNRFRHLCGELFFMGSLPLPQFAESRAFYFFKGLAAAVVRFTPPRRLQKNETRHKYLKILFCGRYAIG